MRIKFVFRIIMLAVAMLAFNLTTFAQGSSLPTGGMKYFLYGAIALCIFCRSD